MVNFDNKTAVITGAASGIGEAMARGFAGHGARTVIADVNSEKATALAEELNDAGHKACGISCDVTDAGQVTALFAETRERFGLPNIVINNAGKPQVNGSMLDVDEATFDAIYAVNVKSIFLTAKAAVPMLRENGGGVIINTASTGGVRPRPGLAWYNGSKGAAITLTKAMAIELAVDNIRVNAINPVASETPMLADFLGGEITNERHAAFVSTVPLGRLGRPRDMANAALFLASDEAEFITGVCLEVDGGRCI